MLDLCLVCKTEYQQGTKHSCYEPVDKKYFDEEILYEFFVQCGLCFHKDTLATILAQSTSPNWVRLRNSTQWKGYICIECQKRLHIK
jgi:uncharacterized protein YlaI